VRTTSYRYLRDLKTNPPQYFRARNVDVHLYKLFRISLYSASSKIVKIVKNALSGMGRCFWFLVSCYTSAYDSAFGCLLYSEEEIENAGFRK